MLFIVWAGLMVANFVISRLLLRAARPKPKFSMIEFPVSEEGAAIPIVYGTFQVAPRITWWGDYKKESGNDGFTSFKARVHAVVCWGPIDELIDVTFDGKSIKRAQRWYWGSGHYLNGVEIGDLPAYPWNPLLPILRGSAYRTKMHAAALRMFGGESAEGGVAGAIDFWWGTEDCPERSVLLQYKYGVNSTSFYQGLCHLTFGIHDTDITGVTNAKEKNFHWSNNTPYPKPVLFIGRKTPNAAAIGQSAAEADMDGDANIAEIIYDIYVNRRYGMSASPSLFEISTVIAAATTLRNEGIGVSVEINERQDAKEIVLALLDIADGVIRTNPVTGKLEIKLIRADYDIGDLMVVDQNNSWEFEFSRGQWEETINEIRITHRALKVSDTYFGYETATVIAQNLANAQARGKVVAEELEMPYITKPAVAALVAQRYLRMASIPLAKGSFFMNREGFDKGVGDAFVISQPRYGFNSLVARIVTIDFGSLNDTKIKIDWIEDVFGVSEASYGTPSDSSWENPIQIPEDATHKRLIEMPYAMTPLTDATRRAVLMLNRLTPSADNFDILLSEDAGVSYQEVRSSLTGFTPVGTLTAALPFTNEAVESGFDVTDLGNLSAINGLLSSEDGFRAGELMALIGDEIISFQQSLDNGDGTYHIANVIRGAWDTVPPATPHPLGTPVYFFRPNFYEEVRDTPWPEDRTIDVKPLPQNSEGQIDKDDVTEVSLTMASRALAPYPPGHIRLDNAPLTAWPSVVTGDQTLSWFPRNRVEQGVSVVEQGVAGSYTQVGDVDVRVIINGVVVRTFTAVAGTSIVYTMANRIADDANASRTVTFEIDPYEGSIHGTVRVTPPILMVRNQSFPSTGDMIYEGLAPTVTTV